MLENNTPFRFDPQAAVDAASSSKQGGITHPPQMDRRNIGPLTPRTSVNGSIERYTACRSSQAFRRRRAGVRVHEALIVAVACACLVMVVVRRPAATSPTPHLISRYHGCLLSVLIPPRKLVTSTKRFELGCCLITGGVRLPGHRPGPLSAAAWRGHASSEQLLQVASLLARLGLPCGQDIGVTLGYKGDSRSPPLS